VNYREYGDQFVLRLDPGEEVISEIKRFCEENEIESGKVMGIGVLREAKLSYFDPQQGEFHHREFSEYMEMISLMGNISVMDGAIYPHLHVTLSDANFKVIGGHLSSGEIGITGEIFIEPSGPKLERKQYQETGYRLLVLEDDLVP
jgi:predicted DNA-binding protein with PD1-like motif